MLNIAVIGAMGRMGKRLIALILESEDLKLSGALEVAGHPALGSDAGQSAGVKNAGVPVTDSLEIALAGANVVIDFSTGDVVKNAKLAAKKGISCVIGTTALNDNAKNELAKIANSGGKIVFASNMSVGVNLLFKLCAETAKILGDEYDVEIIEAHHRHKKDAPSGTAVSLAEKICAAKKLSYQNDCVHGRHGIIGERPKNKIGIHAVRGGDIIGDHTVIFAADGERIELTHKASSRDAFAKGALRAARFLAGTAPGIYDMTDVLALKC